jgi:hypothetical protein
MPWEQLAEYGVAVILALAILAIAASVFVWVRRRNGGPSSRAPRQPQVCSSQIVERHELQLETIESGLAQGNARFAGLETDIREVRKTAAENAAALRKLERLDERLELSLDMSTAIIRALPQARVEFTRVRNGGKKTPTQRVREIAGG